MSLCGHLGLPVRCEESSLAGRFNSIAKNGATVHRLAAAWTARRGPFLRGHARIGRCALALIVGWTMMSRNGGPSTSIARRRAALSRYCRLRSAPTEEATQFRPSRSILHTRSTIKPTRPSSTTGCEPGTPTARGPSPQRRVPAGRNYPCWYDPNGRSRSC